MEAHVKAVVDEAPPPSPEQIARLRLIFAGSYPDSPGSLLPALGHIYVIELSSDTIKVGRASRPSRVEQHRAEAKRYGVTFVNEWLSEAHAGWVQNEGRLIAHCAEQGGQRDHSRSEYFKGLSFEQVKAYAEQLVAQS